MKSRTPEVCEWCHKPLVAAGPHPGPAPNTLQAPQPTYRTSLTGEVVEVTPQAPPGAYGGPPVQAMPGINSGALPASATAPVLVPAADHYAGTSAGERWELCLAIMLPVIIGCMALVHAVPGTFLLVTFVALFVLAVIMGATGAIPGYDSAIADCAVVLAVCFMFGPLAALILYLIVGAIKQECNGALCALLVLNIIFPALTTIAVTGTLAGKFLLIGIFTTISFFAVCTSFMGWLLSGFFRPVNED
jgi:hypothetical protein